MIKLYNGNGGEIEITPTDDSYRLTELMGADEVVLKFALPDYLPISTGAYITYKGDRYEVESEDSVRMIHTEDYEYTVTFSSPMAHLRRYIVREKGGEGRISFFLTAKPREHLDLIVHNLNEREAGWAVGACLEGSEKTIEYSTTNALDALTKLAEAYGTEWECEGRTLSLRKAEYHKDSPLTVSYGKGKGLLSGLERNPAEEQPVGTLYVTGTDRNIDPAKYKSKTLHLPEGGTKTVGGRTYTVTAGGRAITVSGSAPDAVEGAFTDTDIYPSREGVVKTVTIRDKEKAFVDFTDPTIPADLDFEKCLIPGREMKLTFQTGMLAGRTFGAKYHHKDRRFEIVPEEIDGILMPSEPFLPKEGDRYGVFEIALPESYISAAEGRLLDSAVQYLEGLETSRYSYRAAVDPLWLKKQWTKVGHKVRIGAYVRLAGDPITDGGATIRITGIKEYLTDPYAPEVTLSDRATGRGGLTSIIRKAVQEDLTSTKEASTRTAVELARRTFHKAEQLTDALEKALGAHFEAMVRPIAVHTMQVLVGDKSLQFAYVENPASTKEVPLPLTFDTVTKSLHIDRAYLQHKTLGVEVTTAHTAKDFRTWTIAPIDYSPKGTAPLYLYARVPREGDGGTFVIDTRAHDFEEEAGYYHLWSGMLTPTDDGTNWEYMPMHGFTEITPGMISSPRFTSPDGRLVIDMVKGYFRFKTDKSTFSVNADNPNGVYIRGGMISVGGQNLTMEEAFEEQQRKAQQAYEDAVKRAKEMDSEIQVGGRNLAIMSRMIPGYLYGDIRDTDGVDSYGRKAGDPRYKVIRYKDFVYDSTYHVWNGATPLTFKLHKGGVSVPIIHYHDKDKVFIGWSFDWTERPAGYTRTLTPPAKTAYIRIGFPCSDPLVKLERGSVATDWTPAPEDLQAEIDNAKEQATKAQTSTDKLRGYVDGAYKDGIITEVESKTIATYINEVEAMWSSAFGAYERVYTNKLLTGTPKTALGDAKITLAGAKDNLINQIKTAISDGKATKAEATETERLYNVYKTALKDFQKALKEAEDFIRSKGAGGRFLGEATSLGFDGGVQLADGRFVYGKPGDTVRMTNTGSNNVASWERDKIYILVGVTDSRGYVINTWTQLTGKDGAPGRDGRDGVDGRDGRDGVGADYSKEIRELETGLSSANSSISALKKAKEEIEKGKLSISDLPKNLKWIYDAFHNGKTEIEGGLILSKYIGLSNSSDKVTSYISGEDGAGAHMLAAGVSGLGDTNAVSYINYDGTAKFGGVKINRDSIYIDADESKSSDPQKVVRDRLYIFRGGLFAYLKNYIEGGIGHGIFRADYESGFHSKRVSIGGGGTSVIQAPRGNVMGLRIEGNLHVFGDKLEYNDQRILHEEEPRMHDMRSQGGFVYLTKDDSSVLISNEALSSAHCTITLPDASTVKSGWRCTVTTIGAVVKGSITLRTKYSSQRMFWSSDPQTQTSHDYAEKSNIILIMRIGDLSVSGGTAYWFVKEIKAW